MPSVSGSRLSGWVTHLVVSEKRMHNKPWCCAEERYLGRWWRLRLPFQQSRTEKVSKKVKPLRALELVPDYRCLCLKHHGVGAVREQGENGVGVGDQATDSLLELLALGTWSLPRTSVFNLS